MKQIAKLIVERLNWVPILRMDQEKFAGKKPWSFTLASHLENVAYLMGNFIGGSLNHIKSALKVLLF